MKKKQSLLGAESVGLISLGLTGSADAPLFGAFNRDNQAVPIIRLIVMM